MTLLPLSNSFYENSLVVATVIHSVKSEIFQDSEVFVTLISISANNYSNWVT